MSPRIGPDSVAGERCWRSRWWSSWPASPPAGAGQRLGLLLRLLRPEVARAAIDAGRCPLGDHSAFGDRCGAGNVPAGTVRDTSSRRTISVVIAGPQLVTAAMIATAPGVQERAINAATEVERGGLAALPARDVTAPPRELAIAA